MRDDALLMLAQQQVYPMARANEEGGMIWQLILPQPAGCSALHAAYHSEVGDIAVQRAGEVYRLRHLQKVDFIKVASEGRARFGRRKTSSTAVPARAVHRGSDQNQERAKGLVRVHDVVLLGNPVPGVLRQPLRKKIMRPGSDSQGEQLGLLAP